MKEEKWPLGAQNFNFDCSAFNSKGISANANAYGEWRNFYLLLIPL